MDYRIVPSEDEEWIVMQTMHEEFERGEVKTPSVCIAFCDTLDMAMKVKQALIYHKDKPYGSCPECGTLIDDIFDHCEHCGWRYSAEAGWD